MFQGALDVATKYLELARKQHQITLGEASELKLEIEALRGLQEKYDEVCSELVQIKVEHAAQTEAAKKDFDESRNRLIREAAGEKDRLTRMLTEVERRNQQLGHIINDRDNKIKWEQGIAAHLREELASARKELETRQSRINDLRDSVDRIRADKVKALDRSDELARTVARVEFEAKKEKDESQERLNSLGRELNSSRLRNSELESRITEAEGQISSLHRQVTDAESRAEQFRARVASSEGRTVEVEYQLALLRGSQDADCSRAFRLGMEDARSIISQKHPEWDLSFLDEGNLSAQTPGSEVSGGTEYEALSDVEAKSPKVGSPRNESKASETRTSEAGSPSQSLSACATDAPEAGSEPGPTEE